jgi:hypothetical protein
VLYLIADSLQVLNFQYVLLYLDTMQMMKFMATKGLFINVHNPGVQTKTLEQLQTKYYHVLVVMDLQCEGSFTLLADVSR